MTPHKLSRCRLPALAWAIALLSPAAFGNSVIPREPVAIGHEPQFLFDMYIVDNHWALTYADEGFKRVSHQPKKHPGNPVVPTGEVFKISNIWVMRDGRDGLFRMWY